MAQSLTEKLIECCSNPVPKIVQDRASRHLLDWLGCALVGSTSPQGTSFTKYALAYQASVGDCFAIGSSACGAAQAAFLNGGLGNIFEMDDVHRASILHAGDVVVPAALAVSQANNTNAEQLLNAIVRGYEVALRIGRAASASGYSAWYNSGTCGVFGAATAAGFALELNSDELADALGQAGMMASGIWQCRLEPTFSKQLATAHAAQSGVIAAQLAGAGFPGAKHILEGELGFFKTYYPEVDPAHTIQTSGSEWMINDVSFKPWPACRHAHPAIEAALELRERCPANDIASITISTYGAAIDFCDNPTPESDHEARFSLQHCVAVSLLRGHPQVSDFDAKARADRSVKALIEKVSIEEDRTLSDQFPSMMGNHVEITLHDGRSEHTSVATAKGDPENPMSAAELDAKFLALAAAAGIAESNANDLIGAVLRLPSSDGLGQLNKQLADVARQLAPQA